MVKKISTPFNTIIIYYYALMPILAYSFSLINIGERNYNFIVGLNLIFSMLSFLYFLTQNNNKLESYQKYFLIYAIITIIMDIFRGELFSSFEKSTIESVFIILSSPLFILTPNLKKKIIKLFIFYSIASFITIAYERFFFVHMVMTGLVDFENSLTLSDTRFNGFLEAITNTSLTYLLPCICGIICIYFLSKRKTIFAICIFAICVGSAVLSNGRAVMIYMLVLLIAFVNYNKKAFTSKMYMSINVGVVLIILFFILANYDNTLQDIVSNRIYRQDVELENRSEFARIDNFNFFFSGKYLNLLGNGFSTDYEYMSKSGRSTTMLLIGFLNPLFGYGIFSIFYYLFWISLVKKTIKYYKVTNDGFFLALFTGFICIGFTAGFTYLSNMQGFFLLLFFKTYYDEAISKQQNIQTNM